MTESHPAPRKIFAADLWPHVSTSTHRETIERLARTGVSGAAKRLLESVLLHDQIVIPTNDYINAAFLLNSLGERNVRRLLEANVIRFLRVRGALGYGGNGTGLMGLWTFNQTGSPALYVADPDQAFAGACQLLNFDPQDLPSLNRLVVQASDDIDIRTYLKVVEGTTYGDLSADANISKVFQLDKHPIKHLPGLNENQIRIFGDRALRNQGDSIDIVLMYAAANLEIAAAYSQGCQDVATRMPIASVLESKRHQDGIHQTVPTSDLFSEIRHYTDIPDIGEAVLRGTISIDHLLRIRESRDAARFREWFHERCRESPDGVAKEIISLLQTNTPIQANALPVKVMRIIVTAAVGIAGFWPGLVASALDTFLADKLMPGPPSPKFFIERLRKLPSPEGPEGITKKTQQRKAPHPRKQQQRARRRNRK